MSCDAYFQFPQTLARKSVIQRNIQAGHARCGPCHGGILVNVVQVIFPTRIMEFLVDIGCVGSGPGTAPTGAKAVSVEWGRELGRVRNWARKSVVKKCFSGSERSQNSGRGRQ